MTVFICWETRYMPYNFDIVGSWWISDCICCCNLKNSCASIQIASQAQVRARIRRHTSIINCTARIRRSVRSLELIRYWVLVRRRVCLARDWDSRCTTCRAEINRENDNFNDIRCLNRPINLVLRLDNEVVCPSLDTWQVTNKDGCSISWCIKGDWGARRKLRQFWRNRVIVYGTWVTCRIELQRLNCMSRRSLSFGKRDYHTAWWRVCLKEDGRRRRD